MPNPRQVSGSIMSARVCCVFGRPLMACCWGEA